MAVSAKVRRQREADGIEQPSVVPGGPPILWRLPCELGPSGYCANGWHEHCGHRYGGSQHAGSPAPEGYLTRRDGTVVYDRKVGAVMLLPMHLWRCDCSCHGDEPLDLLEMIQ